MGPEYVIKCMALLEGNLIHVVQEQLPQKMTVNTTLGHPRPHKNSFYTPESTATEYRPQELEKYPKYT